MAIFYQPPRFRLGHCHHFDAGWRAIHYQPACRAISKHCATCCFYHGYRSRASAELFSTVVQVIEQQLNGIDNLIYFSSESDKDGSMTITLNFKQGTNPDIAQVQVQNKLQLATALLPPEVQQQGIRVSKATKNFLLAVAFVSTDGSMSSGDIGDFIVSNIQDPVSRTNGVGDFQTFGGAQYAMRIWLDPAKLNNYGLTPVDIGNAITAQNVQISSGELGGLPRFRNSNSTRL
jgi:multidrug efflux pump